MNQVNSSAPDDNQPLTLPDDQERRWLSVDRLSRILGVGKDRIYAWIREGEIDAIDVATRSSPNRAWRVLWESVVAFEQRRLAESREMWEEARAMRYKRRRPARIGPMERII